MSKAPRHAQIARTAQSPQRNRLRAPSSITLTDTSGRVGSTLATRARPERVRPVLAALMTPTAPRSQAVAARSDYGLTEPGKNASDQTSESPHRFAVTARYPTDRSGKPGWTRSCLEGADDGGWACWQRAFSIGRNDHRGRRGCKLSSGAAPRGVRGIAHSLGAGLDEAALACRPLIGAAASKSIRSMLRRDSALEICISDRREGSPAG